MSRALRKVLSVAASLAMMATLSVVMASPSSAAPGGNAVSATVSAAATTAKPSLGLTVVHSSITAGTAPQFKYRSARAPKGAVIVLQRQFGTAHVWETVRRFKVGSGVVTAPKLSPLGRYTYRLALMKGSKYLAFSVSRTVYAYGNISLSQFCVRSTHTSFNASCGAGTAQVGGRVFAYAFQSVGWSDAPNENVDISSQDSSCRSFTVQYAADNGELPKTLGVSVSQSNGDEQDSSSVADVVKSVVFKIDSRDWNLFAWSVNGFIGPNPVYINGTLNCWTSSGDA